MKSNANILPFKTNDEKTPISTIITMVDYFSITINPDNREIGGYNQDSLKELAESIRSVGVLQPITVRPIISKKRKGNQKSGQDDNTRYEIVIGHRRYMASKLAGLDLIPCMIKEISDKEYYAIQAIENIQHQDTHPLDECNLYINLLEKGKYDESGIAALIGRPPTYVKKRLQLRCLVLNVRKAYIEGRILLGHAELISRMQPGEQNEILEIALAHKYNVTQLKAFIDESCFNLLEDAPFDTTECIACDKSTANDQLLFPDMKTNHCTDPECWKKRTSGMNPVLEKYTIDPDENTRDANLTEARIDEAAFSILTDSIYQAILKKIEGNFDNLLTLLHSVFTNNLPKVEKYPRLYSSLQVKTEDELLEQFQSKKNDAVYIITLLLLEQNIPQYFKKEETMRNYIKIASDLKIKIDKMKKLARQEAEKSFGLTDEESL